MDTVSFLQAVFSGYPADPELRLEVRCLPPLWDRERSRPWPRRFFCLGSEYLENAARFAILCSAEWDAYYGVVPRSGHAGGQSGLTCARVLWADVDGGEAGTEGAEALILNAPVPLPHITVGSGSGVHGYWFLADTVPLVGQEERDLFKATLRRLVRAIGGAPPLPHADPAASDAARVLRVPGTKNRKRQEEPREVRVLSVRMDAPRNSYAGWRGLLPIEPPVTKPEGKGTGRPDAYTQAGFIAPWLIRKAERGYGEGRRHIDLTGFGAWLIRNKGVAYHDARYLLRVCADHSPGARPITEEELDEILRWA